MLGNSDTKEGIPFCTTQKKVNALGETRIQKYIFFLLNQNVVCYYRDKLQCAVSRKLYCDIFRYIDCQEETDAQSACIFLIQQKKKVSLKILGPMFVQEIILKLSGTA